MSKDGWARVKALLTNALEKDPAQRTIFLESLGAADPDLRREVESLVGEENSVSEIKPSGARASENAGATVTILSDPVDRVDDRERIGRYRILQRIGEGGMGVVYRAEQEEPVRRTVALKLIKWGMDTEQVIKRFESERQALALMNHPNIASVIDAGATEEGRPYFAMEFIQGIPITDYCDKHRLTNRQRLELFVPVCEGIQHAHHKGIIHRDIKPSNVLVALPDDKPVPKIIDFGVAKAISQRLTGQTLFTELGELVGTPEYMSPEQAEMTNLDIDTRTDVYSLGVLLYELLAGAHPFDLSELRAAGAFEIQRKLREDEPRRPSTRVAALGKEATTSASNRRTDIRTLEKELRGDLDRIVMKAIEKDRTRRYETANAMALDVQRFLQNEPIRARAPSATYLLGKFVDRHRGKVAAITAMGTLTIGFFVAYTINISRARERAEQEATKARVINEFLQETLGSANPLEGLGRDVTVIEALDAAVAKIDDAFADEPEIEAAVRNTIGVTHFSLGRYEESERLLRSAVAIRLRLNDRHPDTIKSLGDLAALLHAKGEFEEAERLSQQALMIARVVYGNEDENVAEMLNNLGVLRYAMADYDAAGPIFSEAVSILRHGLGDRHPDVAAGLNNVGMVLRAKKDYRAAEPFFREAMDIQREHFGEEHPAFAYSLNNLATLMHAEGNYPEAEKLFREVVALQRKLLGAGHPDLAMILNNLAVLLRDQGHHDKAVPFFEEAVSINERALSPDHWAVGNAKSNFGICLTKLGRYPEAEAELLVAHKVLGAALGEDHARTQNAAAALVALYDVWNEPEKASEFR